MLLFAYYVIFHTDTKGVIEILKQIINVSHFFVDSKLIYELFRNFNILVLKQIQKIEMVNGQIKDYHHYHVLAKKK